MSLIQIEARNNEFLDSDEDSLYHLGLKKTPQRLHQLQEMFGGVKYVCMGGSPERAMTFGNKAAVELGIPKSEGAIQAIGKTERCHMFVVGPILSISHGMGMPSISIFLHEVTKLLDYSGCTDVKFIRIGTSGGVGVEGGTVVITENAINAKLEPKHTKTMLGKDHSFPTQLNGPLAQDLLAASEGIETVMGNTMGTDDFYEGQGRRDGALKPPYSIQDRMEFLQKIHDQAGVRNIEMESTEFASFCNRAGIPGAIVCVALLNRLKGDQVESSPEQLAQYSDNAQAVVINYIRKQLGQ